MGDRVLLRRLNVLTNRATYKPRIFTALRCEKNKKGVKQTWVGDAVHQETRSGQVGDPYSNVATRVDVRPARSVRHGIT